MLQQALLRIGQRPLACVRAVVRRDVRQRLPQRGREGIDPTVREELVRAQTLGAQMLVGILLRRLLAVFENSVL